MSKGTVQQKLSYEELVTLNEELVAHNEELSFQFMQLRHELDQLKRLVFGSKHEKFIPSAPVEQLSLGIDVLSKEEPTTVAAQTIQYTRKQSERGNKSHKGRMLLPASLPREQVVIEPEEDVTGYKKIGVEITEELEQIPSKLFVRQFIRPKYAKPDGEGVVIGELPARPIEKGIAGPGLLAQVVIDKFVDHLPIHRQMQRFERDGVKLPYSTLTDWIAGVCKLLEPLYSAHRKEVLSSEYLNVDETPIKVLDKNKKGNTHRGYHWVYRSGQKKLVLFDYREGRGREGPEELLRDFKGFLQTDGYNVYEAFDKKPHITLLQCWAHARRMFDQSLDNDRDRAEYVLKEIQKLYAIERRAKDGSLSIENIYTLRQEESLPILNGLKEWMLKQYSNVLPKSPIGKAISYSLQRWDQLCIYAQDGRLQIDNNSVENAIRPVAIGRKNYMFAGSHEGARRAAMLYSFMGSCKINHINPFEWLRDILQQLPTYPINRIDQLLPNQWSQAELN